MIVAAKKLSGSLRNRGIAETVRLVVTISVHKVISSVADKRMDRLLGASTFGIIRREDLGLPETSTGYEPTAGHILDISLRALKLDLTTYSFVDRGSGKGRTLFYAARHRFQKVIGVEFSPTLHAEAQNSVHVIRERTKPLCQELSVHNGDAGKFELPMTNLILFMYNPFGPSVIEAVLARAEERARSGFQVYVIYYNPKHREVLDAADWLEAFQIPQPYRLAHSLTTPVHIAWYRTSLA